MKITIFQALTLLASIYLFDKDKQIEQSTLLKEKSDKIKTIYLSGIKNEQNKETLKTLLEDEILKNYEISDKAEEINEDPVRRYFEGQLCYETLMHSLDTLDYTLLEENFLNFFNQLPITIQSLISKTIYKNNFIEVIETLDFNANQDHLWNDPVLEETLNDLVQLSKNITVNTIKEHTHGIHLLQDPDSYQLFKPDCQNNHDKTDETISKANNVLKERKEKMSLLLKSFHTTVIATTLKSNKYPLNIYNDTDHTSPYHSKNRGRKNRKDQTVRSHHFGPMRSYMPVPQGDSLDALFVGGKGGKPPYVRPVDIRTYVNGAQQPEKIFSTKVSFFSNSISGTLLAQLQVMLVLHEKAQFLYAENIDQLKLYVKTLIAYTAYQAGGHSLYEFMSVFEIKEIKEAFKKWPRFDELTLHGLFQHENETAFQIALNKTIDYNRIILNKKKVHEEIKTIKNHRFQKITFTNPSNASILFHIKKASIHAKEKGNRSRLGPLKIKKKLL